MRKEYDFSKMKGRKNPYAKRLKKQVTIRMGVDIIEYFKNMSEETGIPYQCLTLHCKYYMLYINSAHEDDIKRI